MVCIKIGLELWSRKFSRILNFNTLDKRKGISEYFLSVYSTLFLYIPWFLLDFYLNVRCNKISNKPTCWWATNIKANFVFTSIGVFGNLKKNENKIFIFEALNLDVFLDRNKAYIKKRKRTIEWNFRLLLFFIMRTMKSRV